MIVKEFILATHSGKGIFYEYIHGLGAEELSWLVYCFVDELLRGAGEFPEEAIALAKKTGIFSNLKLSRHPDGSDEVWDISLIQPYISYNGKVLFSHVVVATAKTFPKVIARAVLMNKYFGPFLAKEVLVPDTVNRVTIVGSTNSVDTEVFNSDTQRKISNCTGANIILGSGDYHMAEITLLADVDYVTLGGKYD